LQVAEESGDSYSKAPAHSSYSFASFGKGSMEEAERHCLKSLDFCEKSANYLWPGFNRFFLGEIYFESREFSTAVPTLIE